MGSWISRLRGTNQKPASSPAVAEPPSPEPISSTMVAIEVYTWSHAAVRIRIDGGGERITDLLNGAMEELSIVGTDQTEVLDLNEILVAVPPPLTWTNPQRRLHRVRIPIRMHIGPYEVDGHAHVPPGARPGGFLYRTQNRFVPMTQAVIRHTDRRSAERRLPVVITNYGRIEQISELGPRDAPLIPDEWPLPEHD